MRKLYLVLLCVLCRASLSLAQNDTSLVNHLNQLITQEPVIHLRVDSVTKLNNDLHIFFNTDASFAPGDISETESEVLTELALHLITDTDSRNILLLAKDKLTGGFKTLDYFVLAPPIEKYEAVKNNDPYPDKPGAAGNEAARIFPGAGQPVGTGALSGKTVWLSPGHGWQNTGTGLGFLTQRGTSNQLVEDFTTAETVDYYLLNYLINAGANVWSVRERDMNTTEIIVNNDDGAPAYTETGTWANGTIAGYGGTYRTNVASPHTTATAVFKPTVTTSGLYWVSIRYISGVNRATDVKYAVKHAGGTTKFTVNQEIHGDTWVYLGQFYFYAGGEYKIIISNESADSTQAIIADAVRLGGGIGATPDCLNGGAASGRPRFEEAARQYARFQGHPPCREDVTVRPIYTEWELSKGLASEINNAVFVSFHTNAGGGTGTESYRYNGLGSSQPNITAGSTQLRDSIHRQLIADIRAGWRSTWTDRGVKTSNLGELRELRTIPGTLIELGFHDHTGDAAAMREPEFRRLAARAVYKGILKFFKYRDGIPVTFLPEEPTLVAARNTEHAKIRVSWAPPVSGGIYGDAATSYRVYVSENGRGFANAIDVTDTSLLFKAKPNRTYFFKITAVNAGGESFASGVVAARTPRHSFSHKHKPVNYLLVDGFDRLDASAMLLKFESSALGNVRRMVLNSMNNYSYMVEHGNGLASCDVAFDGVQNEVVSAGKVELSKYFAVDWFVGEESTTGKSLDSTEKARIKNYLNKGGRLLISGSELGWDLGRAASANADSTFYSDYLKAVYVSDGAGTYNFNGTANFFNGGSGTYGNGTNGSYNVDFPDVIDTTGGSELVLNYTGGTGTGAGVGYKGRFRVLYFGFPIEAIVDDNVRNNLICASVDYLAKPERFCGFVLHGHHGHHGNHLQWTTGPETNTAYYQLEKSKDGKHFTAVGGRIDARGSAAAGYEYEEDDNDDHSTTYYRVVTVDKNNTETISNLAIIQNDNAARVFVMNNPARGDIRLKINGTGEFRLTLMNGTGQTVYQTTVNAYNNRIVTIPASQLGKGVYWLSTNADGKRLEAVKILIQ
ncbi:N-acetylmuramoyl-L-alanine amidase [Niastella sp. OAS944]|uniref:golvesin C-terminal-like domain-containing protein n=1 Tax=Niastella sp. OAS944 TaxID=2664089 RepID=UPI00347E46B6|nr:N-acetylmuramoyl-L-alanine amidase [Chitinophagaceae bacterium OAS944]